MEALAILNKKDVILIWAVSSIKMGGLITPAMFNSFYFTNNNTFSTEGFVIIY